MKNKISKYFVLLIILTLIGSVHGAVSSEKETGRLIVNITGFQSSDGYAMVALSDSMETYEEGADKAFARKKSKVENAQALAVFEGLPYGKYAISLYHDKNSNGKLDKNVMGIPKEAYAFSNNARGSFGKPDWDAVLFQINSAEKKITISFQ